MYQYSSRFAEVPSSPAREILAVLSRGDVISFAGGIPDPNLFPTAELTEAYQHALATQSKRMFQYASTEGEPELREQAARLLSKELPTTADQIQVTSGSQEGIAMTAQILLDEGDIVLVEEPSYLAAMQVFSMAGAKTVGVESDEDGVVPASLATAIEEHKPKFVYLIPTFQNPSGRSMSWGRRQEVARILLETGTPLLEDNPYGALRYEGEAAPSIASIGAMSRQTILLNSASKIIAPGLRIGWIRAEGEILKRLSVAKQAIGLQTSVPDQLVVAHYLEHGDLEGHLQELVETYRPRRDAMYQALKGVLPPSATITYPQGGMFCWVDLGDGTDTAQLLPQALDNGVAYVPGYAFYGENPNRSTMRLSFVTNDLETIQEGVRRLAKTFAWQ